MSGTLRVIEVGGLPIYIVSDETHAPLGVTDAQCMTIVAAAEGDEREQIMDAIWTTARLDWQR